MTRLDSQSSVSDVRFSPHYYGLKFASCSYNGYVRVYEAKDIMRLNDWTLTYEFESLRGASCVCWSQSSLFPLLLAVGADDSSSTAKHIGVYQFQASVYSNNSFKFNSLDYLAKSLKYPTLIFF